MTEYAVYPDNKGSWILYEVGGGDFNLVASFADKTDADFARDAFAAKAEKLPTCVYCGKGFAPDQNHPEHLCWENLTSANQAVETWRMEAERLRADQSPKGINGPFLNE